ncbi:hypothetical protein PG911_05265 [Tenacibaculum ovolyticum]|uniref:hypothetical protein n=1 Tax=Tenacibaculum ovolyticum TaxID=104270 RepID=UPI0022F37D39|nr:hypothetical protein [Tenacibaculum ovolyticum]WBX77668.1 hypothetical protein PG911_05265 [Tenacibaculum ovolyticum]
MKYLIKKRSLKAPIFIATGVFLVFSFSYQLYKYLQTNQFIYNFPGDWDKPLGITVGLFLIIRALKFIGESKELFIKTSANYLKYRTNPSDSVHKITLSNIEKIQVKNEKIIILTKDATKLIVVDFNKVRMRDTDIASIKKSLIELKK